MLITLTLEHTFIYIWMYEPTLKHFIFYYDICDSYTAYIFKFIIYINFAWIDFIFIYFHFLLFPYLLWVYILT